jgi:hypothetical protein
MTTTETQHRLAEEEAAGSIDVECEEEVVIPPTPAVKTALLTIIAVVTTLIELGVSVAVIAAIAYAIQTLVR